MKEVLKEVPACCELSVLLRTKTYPFGVKFYKYLTERPSGTIRPRHPMNVCQVTALARYYGRAIYFTAEDMACLVGAVALGLVEPTEEFVSGKIAAMLHSDMESARRFTEQVPRIPVGEVKAVAVAPLSKLTFEPDIIAVYGNTSQAMRLIQAYLWRRGGRVHFSSGGEYSLCADVIAGVYTTKDFTVTIPCFGDRKTAMAQDDELTVGFPAELLPEILEGLRETNNVAAYPTPFDIAFPQMPDYTLTEWAARYRKERIK